MLSREYRQVYNKYYAYYSGDKGGERLSKMIIAASCLGENACSLYEESATQNLSGDDLESIFQEGIKDKKRKPSIQSLIENQLKGYRHILKFRTALCLECEPVVNVRYILVWKKNKALKF